MPLPLRTRLFGAGMRRFATTPADADQMIALRKSRARLVASRPARFVAGTDADGVEIENMEIEAEGHQIRLRIHRPIETVGPLPVVVNYHGGGWCIGSPEQSRWLSTRVAEQVGALVVSPAYRLAPEDPFPAATDDAWAVLQWVRDHADEIGGDPGRISVMGDSAGGNLAAVVALQARDYAGPVLRSQVLIYPAVDMYQKWPSETENANAPVLSADLMHAFVNTYLAEDHGTEDWRASPLRAVSHEGLPPTLILTAGHDPIRDHGQNYHEALRSVGVHTDLINYPDAVHGFMSLPGVVPAAHTAIGDVTAFLRRTL